MFSFNKKKSNEPTIFPSAKEMHEKTAQMWPTLTDDYILSKLEDSREAGKCSAYFSHAYISKETKKRLRRQGYHVSINVLTDFPAFEVRW